MSDDLGDWKIECRGCGAVSCPDGMRYDKHLAIRDWNTRIVKGVKTVFSHAVEQATDNRVAEKRR